MFLSDEFSLKVWLQSGCLTSPVVLLMALQQDDYFCASPVVASPSLDLPFLTLLGLFFGVS